MRLAFAIPVIGATLWALRGVFLLPLIQRGPLYAYLCANLLLTLVAEGSLLLTGRASDSYARVFGAGMAGVLCAALIFAFISCWAAGQFRPLIVVVPAVLSAGAFLRQAVVDVYWQGVPFQIELAYAQAVVFLVASVLTGIAWEKSRNRVEGAVALFWFLMAGYKTAFCLAMLRLETRHTWDSWALSMWLPTAMTIAAFVWIGRLAGPVDWTWLRNFEQRVRDWIWTGHWPLKEGRVRK